MRRPPLLLALLLAVSAALRAVLAVRGGQGFMPDEGRYLRSWRCLTHLLQSEWAVCVDHANTGAGHTGFTLIGLPGTVLQYLETRRLGLPTDLRTPGLPINMEAMLETTWLSALLLSLASVACIGLTYAIARASGADQKEGLVAAFLMSCATSMFYFSRHLMPYDSGLALTLTAVWLAVALAPRLHLSALCGLAAGAALMTYNGYWNAVLCALALRVFATSRTLRDAARSGLAVGLGFAALPALLSLWGLARDLTPYVVHLVQFGGNAGGAPVDLGEGWSVPWEYFWHAEHGLLLVWLFGAGCVVRLWARDGAAAHRRGLSWLAMTCGVFALLTSFSVALEQFSVHARQARQLVPFLCLTAAYGVTHISRSRWWRRVGWVGVGLLVLQSAFHFAQPLKQRFPRQVLEEVVATYGRVQIDTTIESRFVDRRKATDPPSRYVLLNVERFLPVERAKAPPAGEVLLRVPHPLEYLPYQYDVGGPAARALLRSTDVSMRLIDTGPRERRNRRTSDREVEHDFEDLVLEERRGNR
jgi:hypothetical protein